MDEKIEHLNRNFEYIKMKKDWHSRLWNTICEIKNLLVAFNKRLYTAEGWITEHKRCVGQAQRV